MGDTLREPSAHAPHNSESGPHRAPTKAGRRVRRGIFIGILALALLTPSAQVATADPAADPVVPSTSDIDQLRSQTATVAGKVAVLDVQIANLADSVDKAWAAVSTAGEDYTEATVDLERAETKVKDSEARLAVAQKRKEESRIVLAGIARDTAKSSSAAAQFQTLVTATGLEDAIASANAMALVSNKAERAVQQFEADSVVAETLQTVADDAVKAQSEQQESAKLRLSDAKAQQRTAEALQTTADGERADLLTQLASLRGSTAAAEQARQDKLEADREKRRKEKIDEAEKKAQESINDDPADSSGDGDSASGENDDPGTPTPKPTATKTPKPTATKTPKPTATPTPTPTPPATPKPKPTNPPSNNGDLLGKGISSGTAAQGKAAVKEARKHLGKDYVWAASGPDSFDCSGLTSYVWRKAGVNLQRTSRSQYAQVLKIKLSDLRPGDLVFWGNDPEKTESVYHVAIYIGGGEILEASKPGVPLRIAPMRYTNIMPYGGRP